MNCACNKSLAVLLDTHTWHQLKIYTCLEMSLYPLVSIATSPGRHLKRRGQLKHSFSGAFRRRKGFKRSEICVIFPPVQHSGCVRAMCQGMTAKRGTAGEVEPADKGQTSHRKLEINGSAGCAPCARKQAHTYTHSNQHTTLQFDGRVDLSGARQKNLRQTHRQTRCDRRKHTQMEHFHLYTSLGTFTVLLYSPPPSACHLDEWIWVTVN